MAKPSLAEQIAELEHTAPADYDPEDIGLANGDLDAPEEPSAGREHYLDVGPSSLRKKQHESISDPKYGGVRVSRSQLMEDEPGSSESEQEEEDVESDRDPHFKESDRKSHDNRSPSPSSESEHSVATPPPPSVRPQSAPAVEELSTTLQKTREEERKKGRAVRRQLAIYDNLLDARIRLQKCVVASNRLPHPDTIPSYLLSPEARAAADKMLAEAMGLSEDLFDLQETLITANEPFDVPPRKKRKIDEDSQDRDWDEEVLQAAQYAASLESTYHPHLLSVLQKWSNKVLAVAPSALLPSSRTKFSKTAQLKSATQLIEETLLDRQKLLERTRLLRTPVVRIGHSPETKDDEDKTETGDVEVFDDTDFYQQLLRDVIESRAAGELADDQEEWRTAQKQKKAKKAVDTKASKGRKLRYDVHEKIQNFMVPIPVYKGWHEEQIDELFASLLGKGFKDTARDTEMDVDSEMEAEKDDLAERVDESLKHGFRVFG